MSSPYKSAKIIMAYETAEDLRVECPEVDLVMFRAYSSGSAHEGPLGFGWTHSYEWRAERAGGKVVVRVKENKIGASPPLALRMGM